MREERMDEVTHRAAEDNRRAWDSFRQQRDEGLVDIRPRFTREMAEQFWADTTDGVSYLTGEQIAELVGDVRGRRLLDMGCGDGDELLQWARLGAEVVGVDNSPKQLAAARHNAEQLGINPQLVRADLLDLPEELLQGEFDIVFTSAVTCWIGDCLAWFRGVRAALTNGGVFLLNDPHPVRHDYFAEGPFVHRSSEPTGWNPAGHDITTVIWQHTLATLVTAVGQAGLRITHLVEHPGDGSIPACPGGFTLCARRV